MRLRRFMILVVFCLLGCDDTLQLGTSDGGPMSADGGGGGSGSGSGSGSESGSGSGGGSRWRGGGRGWRGGGGRGVEDDDVFDAGADGATVP